MQLRDETNALSLWQKKFARELTQRLLRPGTSILLAGDHGSGRTTLLEQVVDEIAADDKGSLQAHVVFIPCREDMDFTSLRQLFWQQYAPDEQHDLSAPLDSDPGRAAAPTRALVLVVADDVDKAVSSFYDELCRFACAAQGRVRLSLLAASGPLFAENARRTLKRALRDTVILPDIIAVPYPEPGYGWALCAGLLKAQGYRGDFEALRTRFYESCLRSPKSLGQIYALTERIMAKPDDALDDELLDEDTPQPKRRKKHGMVIFIGVVCLVIVLACMVPIFMGNGFWAKIFGFTEPERPVAEFTETAGMDPFGDTDGAGDIGDGADGLGDDLGGDMLAGDGLDDGLGDLGADDLGGDIGAGDAPDQGPAAARGAGGAESASARGRGRPGTQGRGADPGDTPRAGRDSAERGRGSSGDPDASAAARGGRSGRGEASGGNAQGTANTASSRGGRAEASGNTRRGAAAGSDDNGELLPEVAGGVDAETPEASTRNSVTLRGEALERIEQQGAEPESGSDYLRSGVGGSVGEIRPGDAANDTRVAGQGRGAVSGRRDAETAAQGPGSAAAQSAGTEAQNASGAAAAPGAGEAQAPGDAAPAPAISRGDNAVRRREIQEEQAAEARAAAELEREARARREQAEIAAAEARVREEEARRAREAQALAASTAGGTGNAQGSAAPAAPAAPAAAGRQTAAAAQPRPAGRGGLRPSGQAVPGAASELASKDGGHFALQVIAGRNRQAVVDAAAAVSGRYWIYETVRQGRPWHVLVVGDYPSAAEAQRAARSLPGAFRSNRPFAKSFATIKQEMEAR